MAFSGNTNNNKFAVACARVRQFMMERNRQVQMGDLVGSSSSFQRPLQQLTPAVPAAASAWVTGGSTLSLFPVRAGKEIIRPDEEANNNKATLTIFYQGQVATFPNFPADRAKDLMQMVGSVTGKAPEKRVTTMTAAVAVQEKVDTSDDDEPPAAGAAMPPIARKLTLQRFLNKRKNRIAGTDDPDNNDEEYASPRKKRDSGNLDDEEVPDDASWLRL